MRPLVPSDFPFAVTLTDTEHWGLTVEDFARALAIAPDGCFVVEDGAERAGILTTATYGEVGWVGNIVVAPARRGRGLGEAIILHALSYLDRAGVRAVRLWAYRNTVPLYQKLGFATEGLTSVRMLGHPEDPDDGHAEELPSGCQVYPTTSLNWRDLLPFDREHFGSDRSRVIERVATGPGHPGFLARAPGGEVAGFVLATRSPKGCEVGPWVVDPAHAGWAAPALLDRVLRELAGRSVEMGVLEGHPQAAGLLHARGFHEGFPTERMVRGESAAGRDDPPSIFAIGSLERG